MARVSDAMAITNRASLAFVASTSVVLDFCQEGTVNESISVCLPHNMVDIESLEHIDVQQRNDTDISRHGRGILTSELTHLCSEDSAIKDLTSSSIGVGKLAIGIELEIVIRGASRHPNMGIDALTSSDLLIFKPSLVDPSSFLSLMMLTSSDIASTLLVGLRQALAVMRPGRYPAMAEY